MTLPNHALYWGKKLVSSASPFSHQDTAVENPGNTAIGGAMLCTVLLYVIRSGQAGKNQSKGKIQNALDTLNTTNEGTPVSST